MKIKSLILAMAVCAGFAACSNEVDEIIDNGNVPETKADAYLSVSFTMPNSPNTRGDGYHDGNDTEVGTDAENKITDAYVYLFNNADSKLFKAQKLTIIPPSTSGDKDRLDSKPFEIATGTYKVYVITNAEASKTTIGSVNLTTLATGTDLSTFLDYVNAYNSIASGNYCKANNFLMTNAYTIAAAVSTTTDPDGVKSAVEGLVEVSTANSTEAKAARVQIHVERIAAKITYLNKSNEFTVTNSAETELGTLKMTSFKVVNTRNSSYLYRRVKNATDDNSDLANVSDAVYGGDETHTTTFNYVIENQFMEKDAAKTVTTPAGFYALDAYKNNYTKKEDSYVKWRKLPTEGTLSYCMENTMNKSVQLLGFTTRIIFRGIMTLNAATISEDTWTTATSGTVADFSKEKTFYRYGNKYYRTITQILIDRYGQTNDENGAVAALNRAYKDNYLDITTKIVSAESTQKAAWEALDLASADNLSKALILKSAFEDVKIYDQTYLYDNSIEQYVDGYCYYSYQIRHRGNDAINGLMEFVIVRNNVYALEISKITNVGDFTSNTPGSGTEQPGDEDFDDPNNPNPENPCAPDTEGPEPAEPTTPIVPTPVTPDEQLKSWLNVEINVLKWTIRSNNIIL